jgi:hypothetical protein
VIIHGLLRIEAGGAYGTQGIVLGSHPKPTRWCHVWFPVSAVPGLGAMRCDAMKVIELTDSAGKPIEFATPWRPVFPFNRDRWQLQLDLKPAVDAHAIGKFKGELSIILQGTSNAFEVGDILKAVKVDRQVGTIHFVVTTKPAEGGCDVEIVFSDDRRNGATWRQACQDVQATRPKLFDAQGREFMWAGGGTHGLGGYALYTDHHFRRTAPKDPKAAAGEPAKLVWEIRSAGRMIKLPFEFKDLALP